MVLPRRIANLSGMLFRFSNSWSGCNVGHCNNRWFASSIAAKSHIEDIVWQFYQRLESGIMHNELALKVNMAPALRISRKKFFFV